MNSMEVRHFHVCGGVGSGAAGFNDADPSIGPVRGKMRCIGGVDSDPRACRDFKRMTGVTQACIDLFTLGMYRRFHDRMPPPSWREATPDDMRTAAHGLFPDIVFTSMPCKGFSGLLSAQKSTTDKYRALNELVPRAMMLTMEAFADDLPGLFVFENVPRIASRGRPLLDQVDKLMGYYGYIGAETVHDCGELGDGLAQSRKRMLKVFRHKKKVPPFLYEPHKRRLHAVGDVLRHMPLPGDAIGGPMHRVPALQWKTWVRLAFVEAGSDWRSLNKLAVEDGKLRDYLLLPEGTEWHSNVMGVRRWEQPAGTVTGNAKPSTGSFSIADVRFDQSAKWKDGQALGVRRWEDHTGTVAGQTGPLQGAYSVADVRHNGPAKHSNEFRIVAWGNAAQAVTSAHGSGQAVADPRPDRQGKLFSKYPVTAWGGATGTVIGGDDMGAYAVADLRREGPAFAKYAVTSFDEPAGTVIAGSTTGQGAFAVADVRPGMQRSKGDHYLTGGHYGVVPWQASSGAVSASACHDNGPWSLADPRPSEFAFEPSEVAMPAATDKLVCRIQSLDGTWHRPFTTLELAALQSLIDPEEWFSKDGPGARGETFVLDGESDQRWREGIGNAVPRKAAKAIGTVMGQTILLARTGETFVLGGTPIWVRPLAVAVSVAQEGGTA
jgi:site-specific DNA-cytosine methylase